MSIESVASARVALLTSGLDKPQPPTRRMLSVRSPGAHAPCQRNVKPEVRAANRSRVGT